METNFELKLQTTIGKAIQTEFDQQNIDVSSFGILTNSGRVLLHRVCREAAREVADIFEFVCDKRLKKKNSKRTRGYRVSI